MSAIEKIIKEKRAGRTARDIAMADEAEAELAALKKRIQEYVEVLGTLDQINKMSLRELLRIFGGSKWKL